MKVLIKKELENDLSPEQISGRFKRQGIGDISYETIYKWIWEDKKNNGMLYKLLRRKGKKYKSRGSKNAGRGLIPNRRDIEERPTVVEDKNRFGDLEVDTIIGKNHQGAILTIVDRKNRKVWAQKLKGKNAKELSEAMIKILKPIADMIHTITADNGKEFADHETVAKELNIDFYFAKPYHSWQRGANENMNGLIRQYIPKKTDFDEITEDYLQEVVEKINNRPRKCLDYLTPNEVYLQDCLT